MRPFSKDQNDAFVDLTTSASKGERLGLLKDDVPEEQIKDWISRDLWEFLKKEFGQAGGKGGSPHGPTGRSC